MGNSSSQPISRCFSNSELERVETFYKEHFTDNKISQNQSMNLSNFCKSCFQSLSESYKINLQEFLNKAFQIYLKQNYKNFDIKAFTLLSETLIKFNNSEDAFLSNLYNNSSYVFLLYDFIQATPGAFRLGLLQNNIILDIFDYAIGIYINLHDVSVKEGVKIRYDKENLKDYICTIFQSLNIINNYDRNNKNSIIEIEKRLFDIFVSDYLMGFDCLIRDHFTNIILEGNKTNSYYSNSLPIFQLGVSNILSTEEFFLFCMSNPFISNKKFAYKLYCCNEMGFNISSVIYSFLGFDGPVCIFISNLNKDDTKSVIGLFLNSNFKECFENYVGDDCCFPFMVKPYIKFYKVDPYSVNRNKILYLSSKNHKNTNMKPGIGLGYGYAGSKIWLDMNDPFKQSYFNKNETVYSEGSPFKNEKEILNVFF